MQTWYVKTWFEAADLRIAGQNDPRLAVLDDALKSLGATMTLADRTGAGRDNHFAVSFPDTLNKNKFFDAMLSTPEIVQTDSGPIVLKESTDKEMLHGSEKYKEYSREKYAFWQNSQAMAPVCLAQNVAKLIEQIEKDPKGPCPL